MSTEDSIKEYERILKSARTHIQESMDIYRDMVKRHQEEFEQIAKANREHTERLQSMMSDLNPSEDDEDLSYLDD